MAGKWPVAVDLQKWAKMEIDSSGCEPFATHISVGCLFGFQLAKTRLALELRISAYGQMRPSVDQA